METYKTWSRGYKKNFMLNSAEHEISTAHQNQNAEEEKKHLLVSESQMLYLSCL